MHFRCTDIDLWTLHADDVSDAPTDAAAAVHSGAPRAGARAAAPVAALATPRALTGHTSWIETLEFVPSDEYLISGSRDHLCKIWSVKRGVVCAVVSADRCVSARLLRL